MSDDALQTRLAEVGIALQSLYLPAPGIDLRRWAVIACDQHTANPDYWGEVERLVAGAPSTLRLILPELHLVEEAGGSELRRRIDAIHAAMYACLSDGLLVQTAPLFVLVRRRLASGESRTGLLLPIDLARYDWAPKSATLIRASEETITNRLPTRTTVRLNAPLELPHILLLFDDPDQTLLPPLVDGSERLRQLYSTDLMLGGGGLCGYAIERRSDIERIADTLHRLRREAESGHPLLFIVGDGNHSLAAAREVWLSATGGDPSHPARYALAEAVNLHDPSMHCEPIHRLATRVDERALWKALESTPDIATQSLGSAQEVVGRCGRPTAGVEPGAAGFIGRHRHGLLIPRDTPRGDNHLFAAERIARALDRAIAEQEHASVEYIHGAETLLWLCNREESVCVLMPPIDHRRLFRRIADAGPMPKKLFSLGNAEDKRYYLEARAIG